jgi:hypothetical protein
MEENNNLEQNTENQQMTEGKKHCWKKCLAMVIAAFLGGFLAVYFVSSQAAERSFRHYVTLQDSQFDKKMIKDIEKMHKKEMKHFDRLMNEMQAPQLFDDNFGMKDIVLNPIKVKSEIEDNAFKVIVGLKPFQNDGNKINYNVTQRKLTVFGNSQVNDKNKQEDISFTQDFILPENADITNISKTKDGNKLVISVPLK